jgi:hypothetical protein
VPVFDVVDVVILLPGPQPGGFFELGPIPNPLGWEAAVALVLGQLAGQDSSLAVAGATLAVAAQAVEPTKASLWLRDSGGRS